MRIVTHPLHDLFRHQDSLVELAPGIRVPPAISEIEVTEEKWPYDVEINVVFDGERFVCDQLICRRKDGGPPVASERIREVPVAQIVEFVARQSVLRIDAEPGAWMAAPFDLDALRELAAIEGPVDEVLKGVAALYRLAYVCGAAPTKEIINALNVPRSTASRWVGLARKRGYLGATRERKAGT